jgi:hypothetical protein
MCDIENDTVRKHKEFAKKVCHINPSQSRGRYAKMHKTLNVMKHLRTIPKLFADYSESIRNNKMMRGR